MLIGFGPEVCFAVTSGISTFIMHIAVVIIAMSSVDTPESRSFKYVTLSVTENPTFKIQNDLLKLTLYVESTF